MHQVWTCRIWIFLCRQCQARCSPCCLSLGSENWRSLSSLLHRNLALSVFLVSSSSLSSISDIRQNLPSFPTIRLAILGGLETFSKGLAMLLLADVEVVLVIFLNFLPDLPQKRVQLVSWVSPFCLASPFCPSDPWWHFRFIAFSLLGWVAMDLHGLLVLHHQSQPVHLRKAS